METLPNHSLVPTRLPPLGERALASHLAGHRIKVLPAAPPRRAAQFEAVRHPVEPGRSQEAPSHQRRHLMSSIEFHRKPGLLEVDPNFRQLYRIGGLAAALLAAITVLHSSVFFAVGLPTPIIGGFELFPR